MKSYKELEVWRRGVHLVTEVYKITRKFPPEGRDGLTSQIQRAGASVPANIAEGWGRSSTKESLMFLRSARGALLELETHFIIARNFFYVEQEELVRIQKEIESIGMMINRLIESLQKARIPESGLRIPGTGEG
jgi:four helix bundle protein